MSNIWNYQQLKGLAEMQESAVFLRVVLYNLEGPVSKVNSVFEETPLPELSGYQLQFVMTRIRELNDLISKLTLDTGLCLFNQSAEDTLLSDAMRRKVSMICPTDFTRLHTIHAIDQLLIAFRETRALIILAGRILNDIYELYSPPDEGNPTGFDINASSPDNENIAETVPRFDNHHGLLLPGEEYSAWDDLDGMASRLMEVVVSRARDLHALKCELETECPRDLEILQAGESPGDRKLRTQVQEHLLTVSKSTQV